MNLPFSILDDNIAGVCKKNYPNQHHSQGCVKFAAQFSPLLSWKINAIPFFLFQRRMGSVTAALCKSENVNVKLNHLRLTKTPVFLQETRYVLNDVTLVKGKHFYDIMHKDASVRAILDWQKRERGEPNFSWGHSGKSLYRRKVDYLLCSSRSTLSLAVGKDEIKSCVF